jgi:hypothetical protein
VRVQLALTRYQSEPTPFVPLIVLPSQLVQILGVNFELHQTTLLNAWYSYIRAKVWARSLILRFRWFLQLAPYTAHSIFSGAKQPLFLHLLRCYINSDMYLQAAGLAPIDNGCSCHPLPVLRVYVSHSYISTPGPFIASVYAENASLTCVFHCGSKSN